MAEYETKAQSIWVSGPACHLLLWCNIAGFLDDHSGGQSAAQAACNFLEVIRPAWLLLLLRSPASPVNQQPGSRGSYLQ